MRLHNSLFAVLFTSFALGCSPQFFPVEQPIEARADLAETGRVYALVETQAAARNTANAASALGYVPQAPIDLDGLSLIMVPVDLPDGVTGLDAINALEAAVPSSTVGVNHAYRLQQVAGNAQDRRAYANSLMGWPDGGCPAQTPIGLIDGGLDTTAPIFSGVDIHVQQFAIGSPSSIQHGTDVASVLVDPVRINNVTLFSASVIETSEAGEDLGGAAALVQAIDWLVAENVKLVNISLAGPPNKLLKQAVEAAQARGVVFVAAVGNNGPSAPEQFPAALSDVIAVTALDAEKNIFRNAVRGAYVDFAAPGVDIFIPSETGGHYVSGTSLAAPFVTAYLALRPVQSPRFLTVSTQDLGRQGRDVVFGNGLIQAANGC
ncbi:MAG: S8 family serine peptidase [Octadecabacter sp.]